MIILITGASHIGKTLLAQQMLEKYKLEFLTSCCDSNHDLYTRAVW